MPRRFDGSKLRQARKTEGLSDAELAIALGKSVQLVHLVECGRKIPSVRVLHAWCQLLNVPIDWLFVDDEAVAQ